MALIGSNRFKAKLNSIAAVAEKKALWRKIGFQAVDIISQRTLKGKDYQGAGFANYSNGYKEVKSKRGGQFFSSSPNLHDKGNMFASLKAKSTARNTTLFFAKPLEATKAVIHHKGLGKMPKREFFNLSSTEQSDLMELLRKELKKEING